MHPYHRIPSWLFVPMATFTTIAWLFLVAWLVLRFFGGPEIGTNPLESIPMLLKAVFTSS